MTQHPAAIAQFIRTWAAQERTEDGSGKFTAIRRFTIVITPAANAWTAPLSFTQFYDEEPKYLFNFLHSRRINCVPSKIEDMAHSLVVFLLTPTGPAVAAEAARAKAAGVAPVTKDLLCSYNPSMLGANRFNRRAWTFWLNTLLGREFKRLVKRDQRPGVEGPLVISISGDVEHNTVLNNFEQDMFSTASNGDITTILCTRKFCSDYFKFLEKLEGPEVALFARTFADLASGPAAAKALGIPESRSSTNLKLMHAAAKKFLNRGSLLRPAVGLATEKLPNKPMPTTVSRAAINSATSLLATANYHVGAEHRPATV